MKTFNITDEDLYSKFKSQCALNKKSMSEVIMELMKEYVDRKQEKS